MQVTPTLGGCCDVLLLCVTIARILSLVRWAVAAGDDGNTAVLPNPGKLSQLSADMLIVVSAIAFETTVASAGQLVSSEDSGTPTELSLLPK